MKKPPIFQVRISPELAVEIEKHRNAFTVSTSRPGFVSYLLRLGIRMHQSLEDKKTDSDSAASSLSK